MANRWRVTLVRTLVCVALFLIVTGLYLTDLKWANSIILGREENEGSPIKEKTKVKEETNGKKVDPSTGAYRRNEGWSRDSILEDLLVDRHELPLEVRKESSKDFCKKLNLTRVEGICSDYHYDSRDPLSRQVLEELVSIQFPDNCKEVTGWWHVFSANNFGLGARIYHFSRNAMAAFNEKKTLLELREFGLPCSPDRPLQCWFQPQTDCVKVKHFKVHGLVQERPKQIGTASAYTFHDKWNLFVPKRYEELGMEYRHFRMTLMRYTFRPADRLKAQLEQAKKELNWPSDELVITMHIRHGDKGNNKLELSLLGFVMPLPEYTNLLKANNLGRIPFYKYMAIANKIRFRTGAKTIYLETDDARVWDAIKNYPSFRFLRWQPKEWNLDTIFTAMTLLGQGDYWVGTFTSSFGRWGYDMGVLFGRLKAGVSLDVDWMTI